VNRVTEGSQVRISSDFVMEIHSGVGKSLTKVGKGSKSFQLTSSDGNRAPRGMGRMGNDIHYARSALKAAPW
jgi:hypothetical protein